MGDISKKEKEEKEQKKEEKRDAPGCTGDTPEHKISNTLNISSQIQDSSMDSMDSSHFAREGPSEGGGGGT